MTIDWRALLRIIDWFVPFEVFTAVFVVFALENVTDYYFSLYVSEEVSGPIWLVIALVAMVFLNFASADEEEREELEDDVDDLTD